MIQLVKGGNRVGQIRAAFKLRIGRAKHIQRVSSIAAIGMAMIAANPGVNVRFPNMMLR